MCGPANFDALYACITRLAELSAAGVATYSVCKTVSLCRELRAAREQRDLPGASGEPAVEGSSGHSDA